MVVNKIKNNQVTLFLASVLEFRLVYSQHQNHSWRVFFLYLEQSECILWRTTFVTFRCLNFSTHPQQLVLFIDKDIDLAYTNTIWWEQRGSQTGSKRQSCSVEGNTDVIKAFMGFSVGADIFLLYTTMHLLSKGSHKTRGWGETLCISNIFWAD